MYIHESGIDICADVDGYQKVINNRQRSTIKAGARNAVKG